MRSRRDQPLRGLGDVESHTEYHKRLRDLGQDAG